MIFLWILSVILLIVFFILFVNVNLIAEYKDEMKLYLRILFVKIDLERFTQKKEEGPSKAKMEKKTVSSSDKNTNKKKKKKTNIFEFISFVADIIKTVLKNFAKYAKIKLCYANIVVASDDAAKTAMLYGAICQGVYYITELLTHFTKFKKDYKKINIISDFMSEEIKCNFKLVLTLKPIHVILIGTKLIPIFIKKQNKKLRKEVIPNE